MCWSKRSYEDSRPTTIPRGMESSKFKCEKGLRECAKEHHTKLCSGHGLCCIDDNFSISDVNNYMTCKCNEGRTPPYCQSFSDFESIGKEDMLPIVAVSAVLGVIVIMLFLVLVVLQIKYYRKRRQRRRQLTSDDHELDKISRPDSGEKGSKKRLVSQPGYSWRESVRRTRSKASQKLRSTLSRSVPEDLLQIGLKLAIFGGNKSPSDGKKGEVRAGAAQRCFSAQPALGDGQKVYERKEEEEKREEKMAVGASSRPIVVQIPPAAAAADSTEDTVK